MNGNIGFGKYEPEPEPEHEVWEEHPAIIRYSETEGWGFWDAYSMDFYGGHATREAAYATLLEYMAQL